MSKSRTGGSATITYSLGAGCIAIKAMSVAPFDDITGFPGVCVLSTINMTNTIPGGVWTSSVPLKGSINSVGAVTGRAVGLTTISYTLGTCVATKLVTVSNLGSFSGNMYTCVRQNTNLSNTGGGGLWSSSNTAVGTVIANTGAVTGVSAGTFVITYSIGSACNAYTTVTVNPLDLTTGPVAVCTGQQMLLSNTTSGGGRWSSQNTLKATVGSTSGIVTGVTGGTINITFTSSLGCVTPHNISVNTLSAITGATAVCEGLTGTAINPGSGLWSSSDAAILTISSLPGVMTGVVAGTVTITFVVNTTNCTTTKTITVHPLSNAISGVTTVCASSPSVLTNAVTGGTWNVTNTSIATVHVTTGLATAVSNATTIVTYTTPMGCKATRPLTSSLSCRTSGRTVEDNTLLEVSSEFTLIPNPNKGEFIIKGTFATGKDEEASIEVVNMLGQVVYRAKTIATGGNLNEHIQLNDNLANGMYLLNLHSENETKVFHFVVSK